MFFFRQTRRFSAWIACIAILWAALAPSVAQALTSASAAGSGGLLVEICTAVGTKWVKVGGDEHAPQSEELVHFEHCPFCLSHDDPPALPPAAEFYIPAVEGRNSLPILYYQSPRPLFSWAPAQSRAPPLL